MLGEFDLDDRLPQLVESLCASFRADARTRHISRGYLPSRAEIIDITHLLLEVAYPGYFGRQNLSWANVAHHIGEVLPRLAQKLYLQTFRALCYRNEIEGRYDPLGDSEQARPFDERARALTHRFLDGLPDLRDRLALDVQAAFDGDPAATNFDEVVLAYPGMLAISVYRFAHGLYELDVPIIPRIMSEWAHLQTGIDIHPGARIGRSFFIDHGTGVVIGETADIGDFVKVYQGVTLGALSFLKDERGRMVRGYKRHPTVRDHVTLYANAIVLGGDTVLGEGCTIGGSVFLTSSVPPGCTVSNTPPELKVRKARPAPGAPGADFQI
ncbi:MAG: serine acetyltransferase [Phycisphaerae bacterium]